MDEKPRLEGKKQDPKEEIISKADEIKESVSEKSVEVKQKASEARDSVSDRGKEFRENAAKGTEEFRATAEKMVNDLVSSLKEKQEDIGKTITEYTAPSTPYVDLISTPTEFVIIADITGVEKENISVDVTNDSVTIKVTFPEGVEGDGITYIKRERGYGEVTRNLELPYEVKIKEATANFEDSMLTITLPKKIVETQKLEIQ